MPPLPAAFGRGRAAGGEGPSLTALGRASRSRLARARSARARERLELLLVGWLRAAIRANIRRGRLFEMDRVLAAGEADCLGYARVFQQLGRRMGLDAGIVEVLVDNAGRALPHVASVVKLAGGRVRFVDLWYGSGNISHRRLGLMGRRRGRWRVVDLERRELRRWEDIRGLPPRCVDAISGYMIGNRHLERGLGAGDAGELREAVRCYTAAMGRCPGNSRVRFNRAVALENLGDRQAAMADYAAALRGRAGLIRVQARQHDEVVQLMALDRLGISPGDQEMYLWSAGFMTGREVPPERIAARRGLPVRRVERAIRRVRSRLAAAPPPP